jgi:hypothetical protein
LSPEQKAIYDQHLAELRVGGEEEIEIQNERLRREEVERRRAYDESLTPFMRAFYNSNDAEAQRLLEQGDVEDVNAVNSVRFVVVSGGTKKLSRLLGIIRMATDPIDVPSERKFPTHEDHSICHERSYAAVVGLCEPNESGYSCKLC